MITNFEEITKRPTAKELQFVGHIVLTLKEQNGKPIKSEELIDKVNLTNCSDEELNQVKLRKLVNYIRRESIAPIYATSKGYSITFDREEIEKQILSLDERAFSILSASNGLKALAVELFGTEIFSE